MPSKGLLVFALVALACDDPEAVRPPSSVGHGDEPSAPGIAVDEAALTAQNDGRSIGVAVPVHGTRRGSGLEGTLRLALLDLAGTVTAEVRRPFASAEDEVTVLSSLAAKVGPGLDELGYVVRYEVLVGGAKASGYRSLFAMVPKLELRGRLPTELAEGQAARLRLRTLDPASHAALPGVPVTLTIGDERSASQQSAVTGEDGSAVFDLPARDAGTFTLEALAEHHDGRTARLGGSVSVVRRGKVLVTSDKPIYQPGQTMHLRVLALARPSLAAMAEAPATLEIYDGKGNRVAEEQLTTNAFGIAAKDFALAHEVNTGSYLIRVTVADAQSDKVVEVRPYTLPKMALSVTLDKPFFLAGEPVTGSVSARYFFGKAVQGTTRVRALGDYGGVLGSAEGTLDADGFSHFSLPISGYAGAVTLEAIATDTAGQAEGRIAGTVLSDAPLKVAAWPEGGSFRRGIENALYVYATDPLGRPVEAALSLATSGGEVPVSTLGTGLGRALLSAETLAQGAVLTVEARTAAGERASAQVYPYFTEGAGSVVVRPERVLLRAGDTLALEIVANGGAEGSPSGLRSGERAYVDVLKDGQTVATETVALNDGRGRAEVALEPGLVGDLIVSASLATADGATVQGQALVFVRDATGLSVDIRPDRAEYAPGEAAKVALEVKDAAGRPAVAALGVQIVDEAVFALSDQQPGAAESFFLGGTTIQNNGVFAGNARFDLGGIIGGASDEAAQGRAAAAFATLWLGDSGYERSSWTEIEGALWSVIDAPLRSDMSTVADYFGRLASAGGLDVEKVTGTDDIFDPWGQAYVFSASSWWQTVDVTMMSKGPDEQLGTYDDWYTTFSVPLPGDGGMWPSGGVYDTTTAVDAASADTAGGGGLEGGPTAPVAEEGVRVRKDFPETLFSAPAIITDEHGKASIELGVADVITTWRISALANTKAGALGSASAGMRVFQDFFIDVTFPAALTQNDQISFPVTVYNYLPTAQTVTLTLADASWLVRGDTGAQTLTLAPNEVRAVRFPVTAMVPGVHALTVLAESAGAADAVQRVTTVRPDGVRERGGASGALSGPVVLAAKYPTGTIAGSEELVLEVYPGIASQAVQGLDALLQTPDGCFEQTTATNWPNTLVLEYLQRSGQTSPAIEARATDLLQKGYQRLLTFECSGGGFTWFGDPDPANLILSAMGVLEFSDMARVIAVDARVIARTAAWLAAAQREDGSWTSASGSEFATVTYDDLKTTAFTAWALASAGLEGDAVRRALTWLEGRVTGSGGSGRSDSYALALAANAFAVAEPGTARTAAVLEQLAARASATAEQASWEFDGEAAYSYWGSEGGADPTSLEVTALAVQALSAGGQRPDLALGAVRFLGGNKDALGSWGTTHATILTLRALIAALGNRVEVGEGVVSVSVGGEPVASVAVGGEAPGAFHVRDLAAFADPAGTDVALSYSGTGQVFYRLGWAYYVPSALAEPPAVQSLGLDVSYTGGAEAAVGETFALSASAHNLTGEKLDMVMLEIGIPPGTTVVTEALAAAVAERRALKYELGAEVVRLYLEGLDPGATATFELSLLASFPVAAKAPDSRTWLYYDPAQRASAAGETVRVH